MSVVTQWDKLWFAGGKAVERYDSGDPAQLVAHRWRMSVHGPRTWCGAIRARGAGEEVMFLGGLGSDAWVLCGRCALMVRNREWG